MTVQIITQHGDPETLKLWAIVSNPSLTSRILTVLFFVAILRCDKLRWQGDYFTVAWSQDDRGNGAM
ncbi:MAG: hypothetical protein DRG35_07230 [Deltaproteobacteria bacterium]|nr:MAG: hypothetical protein DRG35_07230 [Deltaproteobacteria bacterium]